MSLLSLLNSTDNYVSPNMSPICFRNLSMTDKMPDLALPPSIFTVVDYYKHLRPGSNINVVPFLKAHNVPDGMIQEVLQFREKQARKIEKNKTKVVDKVSRATQAVFFSPRPTMK